MYLSMRVPHLAPRLQKEQSLGEWIEDSHMLISLGVRQWVALFWTSPRDPGIPSKRYLDTKNWSLKRCLESESGE